MLAPPKPPVDPDALIPEARDRQRRRHLALAVGAAAVAGLGLAIYALVGVSAQTSNSGAGPSGAAPLCRSSQLSHVVGVPIGPVMALWVVVKNTGRAACSLPAGAPTVRVMGQGTPLHVREEQGVGIRPADWMPLRPIRVLQPGHRAGITFDWKNWCGPPKLTNSDIETYSFVFRGGATFTLRSGPKPYCASPGSPSTISVSRPLRVR